MRAFPGLCRATPPCGADAGSGAARSVAKGSACDVRGTPGFPERVTMREGLARAAGFIYDRPYLVLALASAFWGGNIVLGRYVGGHVPPIAVSFAHWVVAFFILLPLAWPHLKRDWPVLIAGLPVMIALAISGISAPNTMGFYGLQFTQALNALLVQSTGPLLIGFWTLALFGERLSLPQAIGILISLTGVVVIVCRGNPEVLRTVTFNAGDLWIVGALLVFGFYSALARKRPAVHPLSFLIFNIGLGTVFLAPVFLWEMSSGHRLTFDALTIGTI